MVYLHSKIGLIRARSSLYSIASCLRKARGIRGTVYLIQADALSTNTAIKLTITVIHRNSGSGSFNSCPCSPAKVIWLSARSIKRKKMKLLFIPSAFHITLGKKPENRINESNQQLLEAGQ